MPKKKTETVTEETKQDDRIKAEEITAEVKTEFVKPKTLLGKLTLARKMFLEKNIRKSGTHMQLEFEYFTLGDIVPAATEIFNILGLTQIISIDGEFASMRVYDADGDFDENKYVEFTVPFVQVSKIVSNAGKSVTNDIQALGSSVTYLRRYLWMLCLDIIEQDEVDSGALEVRQAKVAEKESKMPVSAEKKEEIKKELTNTEGQADELQIKGLKRALKKLKELDPSQADFITKVALKTENFTVVKRSACEKLIDKLNQMITELEKGAK